MGTLGSGRYAPYAQRPHGRFVHHVEGHKQEALDIISNHEEFAVVVSDMRMPGMDGVELLGKIKKVSPLTVRMMLTGNADQDTAVRAINSGNIFHFFNKPCNAECLTSSTMGHIEVFS
jgi:DNA-binding NtrC family response regulator